MNAIDRAGLDRLLDGLEAEELVGVCQAKVQQASSSGHQELAKACQELEAAQANVEKLYTRWQELEMKRDSSS